MLDSAVGVDVGSKQGVGRILYSRKISPYATIGVGSCLAWGVV